MNSQSRRILSNFFDAFYFNVKNREYTELFVEKFGI